MLLNQGHVLGEVISANVYCRHHDLVDCYEIFKSQMTMDIFPFLRKILSFLYHGQAFHWNVLCFCFLCHGTQWRLFFFCVRTPVLNSGGCVELVIPIMCCSPCYGVRYDFRIKSIFGSVLSLSLCLIYVSCVLD